MRFRCTIYVKASNGEDSDSGDNRFFGNLYTRIEADNYEEAEKKAIENFEALFDNCDAKAITSYVENIVEIE